MDLGLATEIMIIAIVLSVILLFGGLGVSVLIHVCIVRRAFSRGLIISNNPAMDQQGNAATGRRMGSMSLDDLEKLPSYEYESKVQEEGSAVPVPDCAVCLENFRNGDMCRLLPTCNHSFHAKCVDAWLVKTPICPICRQSAADPIDIAPLAGEESGHGSDSIATSIDTVETGTNSGSHVRDGNFGLRGS